MDPRMTKAMVNISDMVEEDRVKLTRTTLEEPARVEGVFNSRVVVVGVKVY